MAEKRLFGVDLGASGGKCFVGLFAADGGFRMEEVHRFAHGGTSFYLADRTGAAFPLNCAGGVSTVYNPVPLWMADRLAELPTHWATLYFTGESPQQAAGVLADFAARRAAPGPFTRGLYTRGTEA